MKKSAERIKIEKEIDQSHGDSFDIAIQMMQDEFGCDMEKAMNDEQFIKKVHARVKHLWDVYKEGYKKLEILEKKEGFPAMHAYAAQLDDIAIHLPEKNKNFCHYPFSGIDFYWARIFNKVVFEDIAFYKEECLNAWWGEEAYTKEKISQITSLMREQDIIHQASQLEFLVGNAEENRQDNQFNNQKSTLLLKSHVSDYFETRFSNEKLKYGSIIIANPFESLSEMEARLDKEGYHKTKFIEGEDFHTSFSMGLKNIHIFLK